VYPNDCLNDLRVCIEGLEKLSLNKIQIRNFGNARYGSVSERIFTNPDILISLGYIYFCSRVRSNVLVIYHIINET
jgi:hypothetical protein